MRGRLALTACLALAAACISLALASQRQGEAFAAPPPSDLPNAPQVAEALRRIHQTVTLRHGSMQEELNEQMMAVAFLDGNEQVLEIGGNVGRNSVLIDRLQQGKPGTLVVLESDPDNAAKLEENRQINGCRFRVVTGALSKRPVFQHGWHSVQSDAPPTANHKPVPTVDLAQVGRGFDTLVVDCEGALAPILEDFPELLDGVRKVLIENDFSDDSAKHRVHALLASRGLSVAYEKGGDCYGRWVHDFFQVWTSPAGNKDST